MQIAILLYDRFTALDAIGPYEVLSRLPDARVVFVAREAGAVSADTGMLSINAEESLDAVQSPDVVLIPGGTGTFEFLGDCPEIDWIRAVAPGATWVTSVCSGSLMLGAAGVLDGKPATSHWAVVEALPQYGASAVHQRVVEADDNVITAAGVSAGLDMAFTLAARIGGEEYTKGIQLALEYDPQPPFAMTNDGPIREMAVKALQAAVAQP
jgi:transcriptional regulator GlxA family with amidase domain